MALRTRDGAKSDHRLAPAARSGASLSSSLSPTELSLGFAEDMAHRVGRLWTAAFFASQAGVTTVIGKALFLATALSLSSVAAAVAGDLPGDKLQAIVDEAVASGVPGAVVRVETADGVSWTGAAGFTTIGGGSMAPDSLFRLYSITKTITAATAFTLIDEGKLGLDEPISAWLDASLIGGPAQ